MKDGIETPARLVNLKGIRDLRGIRYDPKPRDRGCGSAPW